jgi:hypothetical protein
MSRRFSVKAGDLVFSRQDLKNGFRIAGIVLDKSKNGQQYKIMWPSNEPIIGWWNIWQLELIYNA